MILIKLVTCVDIICGVEDGFDVGQDFLELVVYFGQIQMYLSIILFYKVTLKTSNAMS